MVVRRLILFGVIFITGISCGKKGVTAGKEERAEVPAKKPEYVSNPQIAHTFERNEQPFRSVPFDKSISDAERTDSAGFVAFIDGMNRKFSESNLAPAEASFVSLCLINSGFVNRYYPSAVAETSAQTDNYRVLFDDKIAVKNTDAQNTVLLFHKYFDCGWNYAHRSVLLNSADSSVTDMKAIEAWVARKPC